MSFYKRYVQKYSAVIKEYEDLGLEEFVKSYIKVDVFIGDDKSIMFIINKIEEYHKNKKEQT